MIRTLGSLSEKGGETSEELRKWMIGECRWQEERLRGQGDRMLGMKGRRYKLWLSGKGDGNVGDMVMEELCEKVVDVRGVSDRVMTV